MHHLKAKCQYSFQLDVIFFVIIKITRNLFLKLMDHIYCKNSDQSCTRFVRKQFCPCICFALSRICLCSVLSNVPFQLIRHFAGVVALLTGKRLLPCVRKHVILHIVRLSGRVAALFTCKGLFSSVCELVLLQIFSLAARIVTLVTLERLLS